MFAASILKILLEVLVAVVVCGVIWRVADADNRSPILWSIITAALCIASIAVPFPLVRLVFAGGVTLCAMFVTNLVRLPPL